MTDFVLMVLLAIAVWVSASNYEKIEELKAEIEELKAKRTYVERVETDIVDFINLVEEN